MMAGTLVLFFHLYLLLRVDFVEGFGRELLEVQSGLLQDHWLRLRVFVPLLIANVSLKHTILRNET